VFGARGEVVNLSCVRADHASQHLSRQLRCGDPSGGAWGYERSKDPLQTVRRPAVNRGRPAPLYNAKEETMVVDVKTACPYCKQKMILCNTYFQGTKIHRLVECRIDQDPLHTIGCRRTFVLSAKVIVSVKKLAGEE
jgi:hypothetical protein